MPKSLREPVIEKMLAPVQGKISCRFPFYELLFELRTEQIGDDPAHNHSECA